MGALDDLIKRDQHSELDKLIAATSGAAKPRKEAKPQPQDQRDPQVTQMVGDLAGKSMSAPHPEGNDPEPDNDPDDVSHAYDNMQPPPSRPAPVAPAKPAEPETVGTMVGDFAYPALNSAAMGWGDEALGLLGKDLGEQARQRLALAHQRSPWLAGAGDVAGAVAPAAALTLATGGAGAGIGAQLARGAIQGALSGAGNSREGERTQGAVIGGAAGLTGAGLGAAGGALLRRGSQAVSNAAQAVDDAAVAARPVPQIPIGANEAELAAIGAQQAEQEAAKQAVSQYGQGVYNGAKNAATTAGGALGLVGGATAGGGLGPLASLLGGGGGGGVAAGLARKAVEPFKEQIITNAPAIGNAAGRAAQVAGGTMQGLGALTRGLGSSETIMGPTANAERNSGFGNQIPKAVQDTLNLNPSQLGPYAQKLAAVANDPTRLQGLISNLSETDQTFRTKYLPALRERTRFQP